MKLNITIILLGSFCAISNIYGQYSTEGLSLDGDVYQWYDSQKGKENTSLVNGVYQEVKKKTPNSHPFFLSDKWLPGVIHYQGQTYEGVSVLYNMEDGEILFKHPIPFEYDLQPIKPVQQSVSWFLIDGNLFKYYTDGVLNYLPGFYHVRYEGDRLTFITRRSRAIVTSPEFRYNNNDVNIMRYDDKYYKIKNRLLFFRLFKPWKKQIRQYIRQHRVGFNKEYDSGLAGLVLYCESLISKP